MSKQFGEMDPRCEWYKNVLEDGEQTFDINCWQDEITCDCTDFEIESVV